MTSWLTPAAPRPYWYNSDGVDLSFVRAMLAKTPSERLQAVQDVIDLLASAKRGGLMRAGLLVH